LAAVPSPIKTLETQALWQIPHSAQTHLIKTLKCRDQQQIDRQHKHQRNRDHQQIQPNARASPIYLWPCSDTTHCSASLSRFDNKYGTTNKATRPNITIATAAP